MKKNRQQRATDATARQEVHDILTIEQKIDKARTRPGNSKKELARLTSLLIN
jgi:hypothetical protein